MGKKELLKLVKKAVNVGKVGQEKDLAFSLSFPEFTMVIVTAPSGEEIRAVFQNTVVFESKSKGLIDSINNNLTKKVKKTAEERKKLVLGEFKSLLANVLSA